MEHQGLSPETIAQIKASIEAAKQEVYDVAAGRRKWTMCIPVQEDDTDRVLIEALENAGRLLAEYEILFASKEHGDG